MHRPDPHQPLCTLELVAEGHASRCAGEQCAFWENGCVLARVESELDGRPEVARYLLGLRRELERGRPVRLEAARQRLAALARGVGTPDAEDVGSAFGHRGPAGGATSPV